MVIEGLDPIIVSKLTSQQVEQVTCMECCKYYIAPETASCGHSLCHSCWKGRRNCHTCAAPVDRKSLKVNIPLQSLTEHIHALADAFEKVFNVKLNEFTFDLADDIQSDDPTKNVKEWLASSENHFSAPVVNSQTSEPDVIPVELDKSKIQIHTHNKKVATPKKVLRISQPQEDWDKIEVLPDTEGICEKPKDLGVGPMDIEPFVFDDNEYTTNHPRRSSRKRELKGDLSLPTGDDVANKNKGDFVADINSAKNSSIDTDKRSVKSKQTWSNVKKMRKEFSKLNKKNRSKLNVSIEMCKKAQSTTNKQKPIVQPEKPVAQLMDTEPIYNIDDNTPIIPNDPKVQKEESIVYDKENTSSNISTKNKNSSKSEVNEKSNNTTSNTQNNDKNSSKCVENHMQYNKPANNAHNITNNNSALLQPQHDTVSDKVTNTLCMPFIKKSSLYRKSDPTGDNHVEVTHNEIDSNAVTASADDIEISIKIGNTVTNIVIKNKKTDAQVKVYTDREIQTSLGPHVLPSRNYVGCSPLKQSNNVQNIELCIGDENKVVVNKTVSTKINTASADTPLKQSNNIQNIELCIADENKVVNKTVSTKINTASADTATAAATEHFDITDSVEKELSDVMMCLERNRAKNTQITSLSSKLDQNTQKTLLSSRIAKNTQKTPVSSKPDQAIQKSPVTSRNPKDALPVQVTETDNASNINETPEDMDDFNDVDIFNSGSVKEANVKMLKDTKYAHSEILMPTMKSKKSQKVVDKRDREPSDDELPSTKKQKVDKPKETKQKALQTQNKDMEHDSESMNYDTIMSQVFANIDADIQNSGNKNSNKLTQVLKQNSNTGPASSQIVQKTQTLQVNKVASAEASNNSQVKENINQKYSENIFSMVEKDSEPHNTSEGINKQPPVQSSTQQQIDNLLTPGMCRDIVARNNSQIDKDIEMMEIDLATPVIDHDDSDGVVEETPQKNLSFAKPKQNVSDKKQAKQTTVDRLERDSTSDSQIIKSIINISDTTVESGKDKDTTVVALAKRKETETPLTINRFVNHIKHNSTPVAKKSLTFEDENLNDPEQTLCPTTTQEKEIIAKAFEPTPISPIKRPLSLRNAQNRQNRKFFIAASCLSSAEVKNVKMLCQERGWSFLDKYTNELTHLVVGVDEENKSQRSVKYMCALAAAKWIVSYAWVEKCLQLKTVVDEIPYEALDACGEPGPRRSRTSTKKIFDGFTFYCMPPFSVLDVNTLKQMLETAGGTVAAGEAAAVRVGAAPALLLAEPEHTQEDRFVYLAIELSVVPVNYEWALNCLGTYALSSIHDLLLCPSTLLPPATSSWPAVLLLQEDDVDD